ncbi:Z1 domain-containing protein [Lysinibacillus sp. 3P01SB]|uniref:Z1 domain-containing protein n=1 Tax=Lysinibacillus sp. 3P01SB TaxID=3132284 RepID=UPI0039A5D41A
MDLNNIKYSRIKEYIESQYNGTQDWEKVRSLSFITGFAPEVVLLNFIAPSCGLSGADLNLEIWGKLVDMSEAKEKSVKVTKLGTAVKSDAAIPQDEHSSWQLYRQKLIDQGWSDKSIESIKKASFEILQHLSMDTKQDGPVKGLVVGNVQSGKTANMAGLMAMAADNGFNYFIILSGVIENLRQQTATRLYNDMNSSGYSNLHWHQVDKPSRSSKSPEHNISRFNLGSNDKDRYFTVCLKNKTRLTALKNWLFSDKNKAAQLKVLIIDDEADQASVNTNKIEEEDRTAINRQIRELVNTDKVAGMNYISYTATPYANILNETSSDSLYPKDFIVLLDTSDDYIGPKQIFGTEEPEASPYIDIIRDIPDTEADMIKELQSGTADHKLPESFIKSLHWFILSTAAMRSLDYRKPISMLVHTSFKISDHGIIAKKIEDYLHYFKNNYHQVIPQLKELYEDESLDFKRSYFLEGMKGYSAPGQVPDYPDFSVIEKYIERLVRLPENEYVSHIPIGNEGEPVYHKGIHLAIDNSKAKADDQIVRIVYPTKKQMPATAPAFIVVGGNTLSRGLTLEGLTTTYFLRTTNQADTLMQMGRWFGYRKGYEIFPRVWLDRTALERFQFLAQMNEELRDEIEVYAANGLTPAHYAPRIKNSSNYKLIRITSSNKMQSAEPTDYDFAGFNTQTIYFENDEGKLKENLENTKTFLNNLDSPEIKDNYMIWRGIDIESIKSFLKQYHVCSHDIKMSSLPALVEWAEKNSKALAEWSVVYSAVGKVEDTEGLDEYWNIHGYSPKAATRTKIKSRSTEKIASIGALRNPGDLLADIDEELTKEEKKTAKPIEMQAVREKYGYGDVPQIIIYRIDKGQMSEEEYMKGKRVKDGADASSKRAPLNFPQDVIGINIMIPGMTKGGSLATYISAKIEIDNENFEEEELETE